jgi:hypothetical protein
MDALTSMLPIIAGASAGSSLIGNIMNSITRGGAISQLEKDENMSPSALSAKVAAATQPLNASLVQAVNNSVQGDMAQRGLAEAPGIFAAGEEQALAPFEQQNQQTALNLILSQLGIPAEILSSTTGSSDPMSALMMLMLGKNFMNFGGGGSSIPGGTPTSPPGDTSFPDALMGIINSQSGVSTGLDFNG